MVINAPTREADIIHLNHTEDSLWTLFDKLNKLALINRPGDDSSVYKHNAILVSYEVYNHACPARIFINN